MPATSRSPSARCFASSTSIGPPSGVAPLASDRRLAAAAREHSEDMVARHFYDHTNPDGEDPTARAKRHGYPGAVGENIYWRPLSSGISPLDFFAGWADSPAHDANMLSSDYAVAGIGFALGTPEQGTAGATATQVFGVVATKASYTGLDMLIPAACPPARKALKRGEAQARRGQGARSRRQARQEAGPQAAPRRRPELQSAPLLRCLAPRRPPGATLEERTSR